MTLAKPYLIPAATVPFLASLFYFRILDGTPAAPVIYLAAKAFILVYPLFFISRTDGFKAAFRLNIRELALGLAVGAAIFAAGFACLRIPALYAFIDSGKSMIEAKAASMGVAEHYIAMAVIVSFVHSMLEEYYWRWFLFGASGAFYLSAAAFTLHHFVVLDFYYDWRIALVLSLCVFAGGLIFNALYRRKRNVWSAWAAHVGADLIIFYAGYVLLNGGV